MLQTMSETPVIGRPSRSVPPVWMDYSSILRSQRCSFTQWLRAVSQIRHANASPVVQFRVTARSGGHVKKRTRSRESDIYLICTQRAPVIDTSNHKDRFGRSVDSPAIRDQADELWLLLHLQLPLSYWWMPRLSQSMPNLTRPSVEI